MVIYSILFLIFVHITLLVPGYVLIKKTKVLAKTPGIELSFGYLISIALFAVLAIADYALRFSPGLSRLLCWAAIIASLVELFRARYYKNLAILRFPLICLILMSIFSSAFIGLSFNAARAYVPDPVAQPDRNYGVLEVKVLNVARTQANDNSIPYRQAQFFINRINPATGDFINEWSVRFFQRTPLMGAVTANYFNLFNERPPVNYIWSDSAADPSHTYLQFQLIAHILNALFIVPAFFLLSRLFTKKAALISCLFLVTSPFFLYNAVFSWPKSLVAFFILLSWLMILEKKQSYTILAGVASGLAYLTHDLAVLYIVASLLLLLWSRRFRESLLFGATALVFALPWLLISTLVYHKPSTFALYPFSTTGIPQVEQKHQIIHDFFHTSPLHLLKIRIFNLVYLLSPYQLFTSEGGGNIAVRLWSLGLFSIPGSIGLGLLIPAVIGVFRRFKDIGLFILMLVPVITETVVIGWPKGLGALHFAESVTVLLCGLAVYCLLGFKKRLWLLLAFAANVLQLIFFTAFSYSYAIGAWFTQPSDILALITMAAIVLICGWAIYKTANDKDVWLTA